MIVLEVAFVLINLAVPYWLWSNKSKTTSHPKIEREAMNKAVLRVIDASGGFPPCTSQEVTDMVTDLCDQSGDKWSDKETVAFERAGADVVFSCEVSRQEVRVSWVPESSEHDVECGPDSDEQIAYAPTFTFNLQGKLRHITYGTPDGTRSIAPLTDCRKKLAAARKIASVPESEAEFLQQIDRLAKDPQDFLTRNRICMLFDPAAAWEPFRKKYSVELSH